MTAYDGTEYYELDESGKITTYFDIGKNKGSKLIVDGGSKLNATLEGKEFKGWSTNKDATTPDENYAVGKNINFTEDNMTLYAIWGEKEDTPGGGSGSGGNGGGTPSKKATAVLANGKKYTDVLTATVLANERNCPILLTGTDSISTETQTN
ncbi:cell wall-binding repeat-containing protein [Peptostreptococcus faecalis]|uniref:cell wall-binding repeat-containing protein n=1 Tax=Peptostreptococcus faecalis TaxID=2045015 RepID=UPI000C7C897F|nr:cell wall-binding repeat-containing protein [Peptostreptococcus faecalis]